MPLPRIATAAIACGLLLAAAPASAETPEQLDALADSSQDEAQGVALAQQQAQAGAWLEALATLDRVLAVNPRSQGSRLLHALYLCAVDDVQGGRVELAGLRPRDLAGNRRDGEQILANARERCAAGGQGAALTSGVAVPAPTAPATETATETATGQPARRGTGKP